MQNEKEERFEDWKGREAIPGKHGGIGPASIACVVENLVFVANGFNFIEYFMSSMHYSPATAANMGLILLTFQSYNPKLQPESDETPSTLQATILFTGLYAMAFGAGGIKASLPTHGGDQLDRRNPRLISRFFNWFYFSICCGCILAVTIVVSIEESKGWFWSFTTSVGILALALFIFMAGLPDCLRSRNRNKSDLEEEMMQSLISTDEGISHTKLKCLDKTMLNKNISATEVAETRTFLGLLPIFFSTIAMNCCLAQLSTFSVQQGMIMNRKLFCSFEIPVTSLAAITLILMVLSIPLYDYFGKRISSDISPSFNLKRIGLGLALSSLSMVIAAIVETMRKYEAVHNDFNISVLWLMCQYLMLTVADTLAFGGMLDFFYREAPSNMKSMSTALGWCSTAFGFFLSTALVEVTNTITGWLGGDDLNETRLELFYVVLFVLNTLNLLSYIFWTKTY
ncbi:hypothetical protein Bca52824_010182 [Brassica carinata]|uniref:Uncharacterized protein n=1 Tax=Brassica carinata TaxID=52824 RepID=A0A8X7WD31_BRACI|nr:hypothetical protein Bca52824_010182 [Brassica carinata]